MNGKDLRSVTLFAAFVLLLMLIYYGPPGVHGAELDVDDGVVEDVEEPTSSEATDDNGEELTYESPQFDPTDFFFVDHFDDVPSSRERWVKSQAKKDDTAEEIAKYDGLWDWEPPQRIVWKDDIGLVLKSKAKHAAIASRFDKTFTFKEDRPLVVQYEVTMQSGQECGGSYIKLLSEGIHTQDLTKFNDKTPYTIMFGPDKCGNDIKLHFIFRHVNPINGSVSEKHAKKPKERLEEPFKDKLPHLYQLVVKPDNTFQIRVDHKVINEGSLLSDFTPAVNPPREIDDPEDKKPSGWDEREKIPDPTSQKPDDWDDDAPPQIPDPTAVKPDGWMEDEPEMIPDPSAIKPDDWDTEIDGEWEAPLFDNPVCEKAVGCGIWKAPLIPNKDYKGKWRAPLIDNPNYQGKWSARKILNPDFFEDLMPFKMTPISAVGIELWSMSQDILFDNLIITDDLEVAQEFAAKSFDVKRRYIDKESDSFLSKVVAYFTKNPLAWKVLLVIVLTPLVFSVYRIFSKGSRKDTAAEAKKTDALQEDDVAGDNDFDSQEKTSPQKKSDLDVKQDTATEASKSNVQENSNKNQSDQSEEELGEEDAENKDSQVKSTGARKRRVRKDQQ